MDLYEAHQRTNASIQRLIRSQKLPQACRICFCTCITLFEGHQWISAFDLSIKLVDLFERLSSNNKNDNQLSYSIDEQIAMLCKICQIACKASADEAQKEMLISCGSALSEFGNRAIAWSVNAGEWRFGNSELLLNLALLAECMHNWNLVLEWGVHSAHRSVVSVLLRAARQLEESQRELEKVEKVFLKMKNAEFVHLLRAKEIGK